MPADTPEEYWRRSVYYPLLDHIANELETRLVVPKDLFLAQYLIPSKLASLLTMPVTSATAERSFSALKRIKTYLRSTMVEDRLNGLFLMHVHPEIPLNFDQAINTFAADGNRRIQLMFPY